MSVCLLFVSEFLIITNKYFDKKKLQRFGMTNCSQVFNKLRYLDAAVGGIKYLH